MPPVGPPPKGNRGLVIGLVAGAAVLLVVVLVAGLVLVLSGGDSEGSATEEVFLEPISTATDPFTDPVGEDGMIAAVPVGTGVGTGTGTTPPPTTSSGGGPSGISSRSGGEPGLYGGTRDIATCDPDQLVDFLQGDREKADAWAEVVGIEVEDIEAFVDDLTPLILRSDTRVTNHGFRDGQATAIQAVLQAGTAVLADQYGRPVVKCYCGNPLAPPRAVRQRYRGDRWDGFDESNIQVIVQQTTEVQVFVVVDITTGVTFVRPVGSTGDDDEDGPDAPPPPTTSAPATTSPPTTSPPTTSPPPTTTERPATTAPAVDPIVGTYSFTGTVGEGSDGQCVAYDGTFEVTVDGSTVTLVAGPNDVFTGPLAADLSFSLTAPLSSGQGTQTLSGQFTVGGSSVSLSGSSTIDSGGIFCLITFTANKTG